MKARDVMTGPVITVQPDTRVGVAAALLVSHGFTGAPVVDAAGVVVGVVTEADLVRDRIPRGDEPPPATPEPTVGEVMSRTVRAAGTEDDVADVVTMMLDAGVRSVPIIDGGELVGLVSRRDVLRAVSRGELTSADVWHQRQEMASHERGGG
jgi:CBS domain-containing protein